MTHDYRIDFAKPEHLDALPRIERAAADLFPDRVITSAVREGTVPCETLEQAQAEQRLWVALTLQDQPVGFAIAEIADTIGFLREMDVHPQHQRRGLGRQLIAAVVEWARRLHLASVALTTYETVPWNAPFYARLGFKVLAAAELTADLARRLENEGKAGLKDRVAMRLDL